MDDQGRGCLGDPAVTSEDIRRGWQTAVNEAVERHRIAGVPLAVWDYEKNEVVLVSAEDTQSVQVAKLANTQ